MRIGTRQPTVTRGPRRPSSPRKRLAYGLFGLALGGLLGYGIATAGPQELTLADRGVLTWTLSMPAFCGVLAAAGTDRIFTSRSVRSAGMPMDDD